MDDQPGMRVSDEERDEVLKLLHGHMLAGRLDPEEHEERVAEACSAKFGRDLEHSLRELPVAPAPVAPVPAAPPTFIHAQRDGRPSTALTLGLSGIACLLFTVGLGAILALPLSVLAWSIGARSARQPPNAIGLTGRDTARTGMWLGVVGTLLSVLVLVGLGVFTIVGL